LGIDQLPSELLLPCAVLRYLLVEQNSACVHSFPLQHHPCAHRCIFLPVRA
jgi:hypothetical protein